MANLINRSRNWFETFWKKPDPGILKREIATAQLGTTRSILSDHPANGLEAETLAVILRNAEDGDADAYLDLAEQMEERDLHYLSVLGTRKRQVSQLPITLEAASDDAEDQKVADFVREWLARDALELELFDVLDGVGKGYSATEIIWNQDGSLWYPEALKYRLPRWFTFDRQSGEVPLLKGGYEGATRGREFIGADARASDFRGVPLPPAKFLFHLHPAKSGLPIRGGLARAAAWSYLFKNYSLKDWVAFAEIYGRPFRIGKYPAGSTEEQIRTLMIAVAGMGEDAAAVIPDSMMIDLVDSKAQGGDLYERLGQFLDRQVSKAVLGQTATTDADTGGLGSGKEHGDVRADIERADAKLLAGSIRRDIILPMVRLNFGDAAVPRLRLGREEDWDPTTMMPAVRTFVELGGRVEMSVIRDRLGLPDPPKDAELLMAPAAAPESPSGAPGALPGAAYQEGARVPRQATMPGAGLKAASEALRPPYFDLAGRGGVRNLLVSAASRAIAAESDDIDLAAAAIASEQGRALLAPIVEPLLAALAAGASFEEARAILDSVAGDLDETELEAALERACLVSRAAGVTGG